MRILVVNPNTTASMTEDMAASAARYANPGTEVVGVTPAWGPPGIEGYFEGFLSAVAVMEAVTTYPEPFDAVVMAGFGEPGREGVRELLDVPVMDITESAALFACTLGHRFSVVTTIKRAVPTIEEIFLVVGIQDRCASIRPTGLGVLELERDQELTKRRLAEEARLAIDEDGAEVIVLGCGGLGGFDKELEAEVGVPVVDGIVAAVKMAEACHAYGVSTSKVNAFGRPNPKEITGWPQSSGPLTTTPTATAEALGAS
jgi:allantoin racemase